jgi:hypothetical protein
MQVAFQQADRHFKCLSIDNFERFSAYELFAIDLSYTIHDLRLEHVLFEELSQSSPKVFDGKLSGLNIVIKCLSHFFHYLIHSYNSKGFLFHILELFDSSLEFVSCLSWWNFAHSLKE